MIHTAYTQRSGEVVEEDITASQAAARQRTAKAETGSSSVERQQYTAVSGREENCGGYMEAIDK